MAFGVVGLKMLDGVVYSLAAQKKQLKQQHVFVLVSFSGGEHLLVKTDEHSHHHLGIYLFVWPRPNSEEELWLNLTLILVQAPLIVSSRVFSTDSWAIFSIYLWDICFCLPLGWGIVMVKIKSHEI